MHIMRGDFHRHTELSWDGGGTSDGNLQDFYRYMIDAAAMDFGASTDHQGGAWPYWWWYTQKMTDMYHVPGAYVPIFGYERSALYPNGHRNMFFAKRSESRVTPFFLQGRSAQVRFAAGRDGRRARRRHGRLVAENDTKLLYEEIRGAQRHRDFAHVQQPHGHRLARQRSRLEPVVEIFQGARANSEQFGAPLAADPGRTADLNERAGYQPEGMRQQRLGQGLQARHHHQFRPRLDAHFLRDGLHRRSHAPGLLDAIRKRHTYGAMDNIILDVRMGEHFMGDEFPLAQGRAAEGQGARHAPSPKWTSSRTAR